MDESKFTVLAMFYFVFKGNHPSTSPQGAYIWRGDLTEGFLHYRFGGLTFGGANIHGGAYFWNSTVYLFINSLRDKGWGFPQATNSMTPNYFNKKNRKV